MRKVVLVLLAAAIAVPAVAAPPYEPYPGTKRSSGGVSSSSSSSGSSQTPATTYGSGVKTYGIGGSDAEFDYKPAASTSSATSSGVPSSNWDTYSQMQQMQQEIQTLRGTVEQLSNELELMRKQARERYLDLDTRINQLRGGAAAVPVASGGEATENVAPASASAASADDKTLYDQASELRRQQKFDESIAVMEDLLKRSPDGMYAPYCEYWLGEMYMVVKPVQLDKAKAHFITLIGNHGDHVKVPDAMYKLGKLFASQGEKAKAKATLNELVKKHPDKPAANLAKDLLKTL
jgi:tol-pal system protein YbgF